jgi:MFS transporter, DHA1 family, inner membrane transport protein
VLSMGIFTVGNLISAMADSYSALMIGRIITSFNHGVFFGVGSVVATQLVPPNQRAGAVAAMFSGLTIATIGGVPLASFIGTTLGWRNAFFGIAGIGVVAMVALRISLPPLVNQEKANIRNELAVLSKGPVLAALLLTVVGASSMFTVFTYIVPILQQETYASTTFVTAMLVLYGAGLAVGNILGGRFADRSLYGTLIVSLIAVILLLIIFAATMSSSIIVVPLIFLWGIASFAVVPPLQSLVVHEASEAPNLASAMNIGAFNLGNAVGAALGGGVISAGLGLPSITLAGAGTAALGLLMVLLLKRSPSNQNNEQVASS